MPKRTLYCNWLDAGEPNGVISSRASVSDNLLGGTFEVIRTSIRCFPCPPTIFALRVSTGQTKECVVHIHRYKIVDDPLASRKFPDTPLVQRNQRRSMPLNRLGRFPAIALPCHQDRLH